ncbi:MAG: phasin family protein [Pseudomonadota bacterium]
MTDDKNKVADKVTDKAGEIAKNIWLAGVGAYGRAVDEAQGRLEKAGVEPPKLFRDLVKAGAALEEEARDAIEAGQAARNSVEDRINRVRENFNLQRPARGEDLLALHEKIDRLGNRIDELTEALAASGVLKPQRKTATKRKKAATAKKSAGNKSKAAPAKNAKAKRAPATPRKTGAARAPRKAAGSSARK